MGCAGSSAAGAAAVCQASERVPDVDDSAHDAGGGRPNKQALETGMPSESKSRTTSVTSVTTATGALEDRTTSCDSNTATPTSDARGEPVVPLPSPTSGDAAFLEAERAAADGADATGEEVAELTESELAVGAAAQALAEAERMLRQHKVLQAEELLSRALSRLERAGGGEEEAVAKAISSIRTSDTYAAVVDRCRQYDALAKSIGPPDEHQKLVWEGEASQLWVYAPPGETWFEFKVICDVDAPLSHCMAYGNELDLVPEYEPSVVGEPTFLGEANPWLVVARVVVGMMLLRVELINEIFRFYDTERGFLGESIRSAFNEEGRPIPARHWRNVRVKVNSQSLWIPQGGGQRGTLAIQTTRAEAGFKIPDWVLKFFIGQFAPQMVGNLRKNASRVGVPGGPYARRLAADRLGAYAECAKVEEAAARREAVSASNLPSQDWIERPWRLTDKFAAVDSRDSRDSRRSERSSRPAGGMRKQP